MSDPESRKPLALIVEDNQVNRMVATQMLRRGGIDAIEANGAAEAIVTLQAKEVDVILMDVQMPGMDGLEAAREIRRGRAGAAAQETPIIAMTAYASKEDESACYDAGMNAYLSKPLNMQAFIETVQRTIQETAQ
ncbi:MAG: response regulator [Spirochaetales bacterium]